MDNKTTAIARKMQRVLISLSVIIPALAIVIFFSGVMHTPEKRSDVNAAENVTFSQRIKAQNPVAAIGEAVVSGTHKGRFIPAADYLIVASANVILSEEEIVNLETNQYVRFEEETTFINTPVLLQFHSTEFLGSTFTDEFGRWVWSNPGAPLVAGDHTVTIHYISQETKDKQRVVYVKKYAFTVTPDFSEDVSTSKITLAPDMLSLPVDVDTQEQLLEQSQLNFFELSFADNKTLYSANESMGLQFAFTPLTEDQKGSCQISNSISYFVSDTKTEELVSFQNSISIDGSGTFVQPVTLDEKAASGKYVVSSSVEMGDRSYIQFAEFDIKRQLDFVGGTLYLEDEQVWSVLVFNIVFILLFIIVLLLFILREYRRYFVYGPIDEHELNKKGFIK